MTREAKTMAEIILLTIPTIQYGGYFLLTSLVNRNSPLHGECVTSEFLPRRSRPRGGICDPFALVSNICGCSHPAAIMALARAYRRTDRSHPDSGGILLIDDFSGGDRTKRADIADLRGNRLSGGGRDHAGRWSASRRGIEATARLAERSAQACSKACNRCHSKMVAAPPTPTRNCRS